MKVVSAKRIQRWFLGIQARRRKERYKNGDGICVFTRKKLHRIPERYLFTCLDTLGRPFAISAVPMLLWCLKKTKHPIFNTQIQEGTKQACFSQVFNDPILRKSFEQLSGVSLLPLFRSPTVAFSRFNPLILRLLLHYSKPHVTKYMKEISTD